MSPLPPQGLAASFVVPLIVISPMGYGEEKGWGTPLPPLCPCRGGRFREKLLGGRWEMEDGGMVAAAHHMDILTPCPRHHLPSCTQCVKAVIAGNPPTRCMV